MIRAHHPKLVLCRSENSSQKLIAKVYKNEFDSLEFCSFHLFVVRVPNTQNRQALEFKAWRFLYVCYWSDGHARASFIPLRPL